MRWHTTPGAVMVATSVTPANGFLGDMASPVATSARVHGT
jgi:hypothetical protein